MSDTPNSRECWIARMLRDAHDVGEMISKIHVVERVGNVQIATPPGYVMNSYEIDGGFLVTFERKEPE